ncbi:MAG: hypothetical protein JO283_13665 [Bradyrhizobium sp.]|nr:hypothetical protein [Bradyrhizobium sp.]
MKLDDDTDLGRLTYKEFAELSHHQIWDGLTYAGCCGALGVLFLRDDDSVGLEDANSVHLEDKENDDDDDPA